MMGELLAASQSSLLLPKLRFQASSHGLTRFNRASPTASAVLSLKNLSETSVSCQTIWSVGQRQRHSLWARRAAGTSDSEVSTTLNAVSGEEGTDIQPDSGGSGNDFGGPSDNGGGGGRGEGGNSSGGGNDNEGDEGSDESQDKKMVMSMSQKLTLAYAALVGIGGVIGYLKNGSQKSLMAGGLSALLLYSVYTMLPTKPVFASSLGLGLSAALLGVMGSRFKKSGKVFPAGVVSFVSLVMSGGYLHGILRSLH